MAGTLSATFKLGTTSRPDFVGNSNLAVLAIEKYAQTALLGSAGFLDVASILARFERSINFTSNGTITETHSPIVPKAYDETGTGTLSATAVNNYVRPPNTTATQGTTSVPIGTTGCWVTLVGGGNAGGNGVKDVFPFKIHGGGGGGSGAKVNRSFISRSQLGTTWSCIKGNAGQNSSFTSAGKVLTAQAGFVGLNGLRNSGGAGGAGGTISNPGGFTGLSTANGAAGGDGWNGSGPSAEPGGGAHAGSGGGGGGVDAAGTGHGPGNGGNPGGGAGGDTNENGAGATTVGAGGGGGGSGWTAAGIGGAGLAGSVLIEWAP